jgi:hypothetical protein
VHAAAPGPTAPYPAPAPAPAPGSGRGRTVALAAAILAIALAGAWGLKSSGLLGGNDGSPSAGVSSTTPVRHGGGSGATTGPTAVATTTTRATAGPTTTSDSPTTSTPTGTGGSTGDDGDNEPGTIPDDFDGDWSGRATQPLGSVKSWDILIGLESGETTGRLKLKELRCSGKFAVTSASDRVLTLDAVIDHDPKRHCAPQATIRLTLIGSEQISFFWTDAADPANTALGTLTQD